MKAKKRHYRLEVEWEDSTVLTRGWMPIRDVLARRDAVICTSLGLVLADDDKGLVLAASVHGDEAVGITIIPRSQIRKRRRLTA